MMYLKNTERFSDRVDNYVKYRPGYPKELVDYLYNEVGLSDKSIVADVGSGTGAFTRLLLERGSRVYAVEPNKDMVDAAREALCDYEGYHPVCGTAENTGLDSAFFHYVTCAQAFHWFDKSACREEFHRILKPGGKALIIWYRMFSEGSSFMKEYERLHFSFSRGGRAVDHRSIGDNEMKSFFREGIFDEKHFYYSHILDFEGLKGRLLSSSHAPLPGDENYAVMERELERLYRSFENDEKVEFLYRTDLYYGFV